MQFVKDLKELSKKDVVLAGGKGASLGELMKAGILVPGGFVVLSAAFDLFLESRGLNVKIHSILRSVNLQEMQTVDKASKMIRAMVLKADMPKEVKQASIQFFKDLGIDKVAVRSSGTVEDSTSAAWAGQLESYLNTTQESLIENIKKCWASLFTPRAIFYRLEKGLEKQKISVAVVVQKMVQSEVSGVAFSTHPVTQERDKILIEAGFGLGEAIVSGQITPDSYMVDKRNKRIIEKKINPQKRAILGLSKGGNKWQDLPNHKGKQQKLSDSKIIELSKQIQKIEQHYGFPVDVEWAHEKGKFYIVQSRPITTLSNISAHDDGSKPTLKKEDYELTFWAQGVSIFVTDIHWEIYPIDALFIIDRRMFKEYLTKQGYEQALDLGFIFYSDKNAFDNYQKNLSSHCDKFKEYFELEIKNQSKLSQEKVVKFFEYAKKLCGDYAQMNFEYTDKAFAQQENNPIIKKNLSGVAKFKDTVRAVMNMALFEPDGYVSQLFVLLGKQFDLPPAVFHNLTQKEILGLFEGNKPIERIVSKRQEAFVEGYGLEGFYEGRDAEIILQEFREEVFYSEVVQGQVASGGKVRGIVKVIPVDYSDLSRVDAEIEKMNQGAILVAETTAPELIVACKKAGAIVTDMGGLMSHAAIVSREFGIPCIVGTKNASKLLKDGDCIEVDADRGIITIIDSKKPDYYELMFSREFCLPNIEIWCRGESTEPRRWTENQQPVIPYIIFEHVNDTVNCYMAPKGIAWLKSEIRRLMQQDKGFVKKTVKTFKNCHKRIAGIIQEERTLNHKQLVEFIDEHIREWPWFEGIWWLMEVLHEDKPNSKEFKLVQQARAETDNYGDACDRVLLKSLRRIFPKLGDLSSVLTIEEIRHKKIPSKKVLAKRMKYYIFTHKTLYDQSTIKDIEKLYRIEVEKRSANGIKDVFKGQTAYLGVVRGRVRKIMGKSKVGIMQQGEILISPMTTVDFLPAMKKAIAIVTDEGGITCHAAIVARELKKPCIIGTKIATKALKDGDLIEVDANQGIVRILSSSTPPVYEKLFSRDFCLASIEAWVRGESTNPKGWTKLKQPFLPFIVTERSDDTVHFYYDLQGVEWVQDLLAKLAKENKGFLKKVETTVLKKLRYIRPIYEEEKTLKQSELKRFLKELEAGYPWFEAMWWYCQMDASKLTGLNLKGIQKVRALTDKLCNSSDVVIRKSLIKIYPKLGELVSVLSTKEIRSGKVPKKSELEKRDKRYFFGNNHLLVSLSKSSMEKEFKIQFAKETVDSSIREIKGDTAQKGVTKGRVKRVMGHKQINEIKEGEILVSPMTLPDFLPAMKKAAAIVTDEGGVVCHAAIVARELKKPCITGTKTATQVLKDGDLVEVDANQGVVRILSKR